MNDTPWQPRSAFERLANCIFLGRLIDKARRSATGLPIGEYMYGENDYMDARVLRFLRASRTDVDRIVREQRNDAAAARELVERSGRSAREVDAFNTRMMLLYGLIFTMFDADEGRKTGVFAGALAGFYNRVIYPPFAKKFARDERSRAATQAL